MPHAITLSRATRAATLALACTALHAGATTPSDVRFSRTAMVVEHVTASSPRPYAEVKKDLETRLGRLDDNIRASLKAGDVDALRTELTKAAGKDGLVIHYLGVHGDWLILKGARGQVTEYFVGNILSAVEMTSANPAAGLYAPLRIVVYATPKGGTAIEYDRPSTQLNQYHDADIDTMGRSLDDRLDRLVASTLTVPQ